MVPNLAQVPAAPSVSTTQAAVLAGATVGLLAYLFKAPLWAAIVLGSGGALATKGAIDKAATA